MSQSNYTPEVRNIFRTMKPPLHGFVVDMVEYPSGELALRVYKDNVESFSDGQKIICAEYLYKLRDTIRDIGYKCHIEGLEQSPPNLRGSR